MDFLPNADTLSFWLIQYGSIALFVLLTIGIVALPIPEETMMVIAGVLMHRGKLNIPSTVIAAFLGCLCGISVSYLLGRLTGVYLLRKYGRWVGITEKRLKKAHNWFERFGKWALLIGYFIPGVRHFTGFSAGTSYMRYRHFALFAYTGALIWVSIFLSIGYFFGHQWLTIYEQLAISIDIFDILGILLVIGVVIYFVKRFLKRK